MGGSLPPEGNVSQIALPARVVRLCTGWLTFEEAAGFCSPGKTKVAHFWRVIWGGRLEKPVITGGRGTWVDGSLICEPNWLGTMGWELMRWLVEPGIFVAKGSWPGGKFGDGYQFGSLLRWASGCCMGKCEPVWWLRMLGCGKYWFAHLVAWSIG